MNSQNNLLLQSLIRLSVVLRQSCVDHILLYDGSCFYNHPIASFNQSDIYLLVPRDIMNLHLEDLILSLSRLNLGRVLLSKSHSLSILTNSFRITLKPLDCTHLFEELSDIMISPYSVGDSLKKIQLAGHNFYIPLDRDLFCNNYLSNRYSLAESNLPNTSLSQAPFYYLTHFFEGLKFIQDILIRFSGRCRGK